MSDDSEPEPEPGPAGAWAPVVYFRTYRVDAWWRALPGGVDPRGPVAGVIAAAVGDGRFPAPRFVLARLDEGTLAGVACAASQFGTRMAADANGRPLYGFAGWHCADPRVSAPTLGELAGDWERLVRAEYDTVMGPAWLASAAEAQVPVVWAPGAAPWPGRTGRRLAALPPGLSDVAAPDAGILQVLPSVSAPLVWQAVADYGVRAAVVTGWKTYQSAVRPYLTHVCADDATGAFPVAAPPPPGPDRGAGGSGSWDQARSGTQHDASAAAPEPRPGRGADQDPASPGSGLRGRLRDLGDSGRDTFRAAAGPGGSLLGRLRDLGDNGKDADPDTASPSGSLLGRLRDRGEGGKDADEGPAGGGGGLIGRLRGFGGVVKAISAEPLDYDVPPPPPDWSGGWTFQPPATFAATEGPLRYWYALGDQAIHVMDRRVGQQLDWTGSDWVASTAAPPPGARPERGPDSGPGAGKSPANSEDAASPTDGGLRMAAPQPMTEEKRRKLNATFGGLSGFTGLPREPETGQAPAPEDEPDS